MDFVRKLVRSTSQAPPSQSNNLGLLTLRRQFRDVCFTTRPITSGETEEKLYTVLPLFLQVFRSLPPHDMKEKFGDVLQFSTRVSGLMVTEIRRRASNKSTEQASVDIANFLAVSDGGSKGWTLLNVLSLLAAGDQSIIDCMTATHLPSTLVKCLYLFFDLPSHEYDRSFTVSVQAEEMLQKIFVQTLVRLCGYISPAEELSRKDDLALLFSAVTSWCSPHNKNWRSAASDVLITISRHGLSHHVVQYIRSKHCIKTCINNLWRATVSVEENSPSSILLDVDLAEQLLCVLRFINNTSAVTQLLLDDFRQHQGYLFIGEFILRLENAAAESEPHKKALLSVIGSIEKLTTCGFNELPPDPSAYRSFQTNFTVPSPMGKGESVRNTHAFELLETLFLRCRSTLLARAVLDAVFAVYCRDPANYFILFNLNTMSSFSERLASKNAEIYPHNVECGIACLTSLQKLLSSNLNTYKDVFREVGLFEMLVKCLQRYSSLLKTTEVDKSDDVEVQTISENHHVLGRLTMDVLVEMIHSSSTNAGVFRETGGARCAYNTLSYSACRRSALALVESLVLQPAKDGNDDDMATILGLLSTIATDDIQLKIDILKSIYKVVSKSDAASVMFRNVGGILSLISILVSMEGYMSTDPPPLWVDHSKEGFVLLETVFHILTVALKLPLNEKHFESEIGYDAILKAVMHLGCFSPTPIVNSMANEVGFSDASKPTYLQETLLHHDFPASNDSSEEVFTLRKILCFFKLLYMAACDLFKDEVQTKIEKLEHSISKYSNFSDDSPRKIQEFPHGLVLHPNILKLFLRLIPCLHVKNIDEKIVVPLQLYLLEQINLILNNERNEQIVCDVGFLSTLLSSCEKILIWEDQPLNIVCQKTLERLATQSISPQELRMLLRIGNPLHCENLFLNKGVVPLNRVKSLVSLATPRNVGMINDISSTYKAPPPFIEFDMTVQGNSHLFIPFIFPQLTSSPPAPGVSAPPERVFPPAHSMAVSLWFYVENFCRLQVHPVRLLTLERQIVSSQQSFLCFSIMISPRRHRLVISTSEFNSINLVPGCLEFEDSKETVSFNMDHLCGEGQWHHLQVTLQRATVLKQSTVTACINGGILGVSKIRFINTCPGGNSQQSLNSPIAVHGWVGTPPQLGTVSSLVWRLGSLRLFDETSSFASNIASVLTNMGPNFVGNYQNVVFPDGNIGAAFMEDHLCFSLLPTAVEAINPVILQRSKLKLDIKIVLAKLNIKKMEELSSFDFYPNASFHAPGPARTYGGFAIGRKYKEAPRCFLPSGVGRVLQDVGGISVSLYLVAMAKDIEGLYAAVKFLVCVLKSDERAMMEMERSDGYQALGMLLKEKKHLLNSHILHLTFSIAGTIDTGQATTAADTNHSAFEYLLSDLEIWHNAPQDLHKSLFDHFYELLTESCDMKKSHSIITGFNFIKKCMHFLYSDSSLSYVTITTVVKVILAIFAIEASKEDLLCFGQFVVSLITSTNVSEKELVLGEPALDFAENQSKGKIDEQVLSKRTIHFRNILLELTTKCISSSLKEGSSFCEVFENFLGFDWVLLFMQSHLHHSTVTAALRLLFIILQCSYSITSSNSSSNLSSSTLQHPALPVYSTPLTLIDRFRSGEGFGGWLQGTDKLIEKKEDSLLGFNVRSISDFTSDRYHHSVLMQAVPVPGFLALQNLLSFHASSQPVLKLLLQFFIGQYDTLPRLNEFSREEIRRYLKAGSQPRLEENQKIISLEIVQALNVMLRQLLHQNFDNQSNIRDIPFTLIDAFEFAYSNDVSGLLPIFVTPEFLTSFFLAMLPPEKVVSLTAETSPKDLLSLEGLLPSPPAKLSAHPSTDAFFSFLCKILWDSTTGVKNKSCQIIDILLEIPSEKSDVTCVRQCVSNLITYVIDYCVPSLADLIKTSHCSSSIAHLVSRIVDKAWQGMYKNDSKKIFEFISHLISSYHHKLGSQVLNSLYRNLYRLILYQLSRKHSRLSEQMTLLDALHGLTTQRNVVFNSRFRDSSFLPSLCHCLFMVSGDSDGNDYGLESEHRQTTWHVSEASKQSSPTSEQQAEQIPVVPSSSQGKGQLLLNTAAARVWKELMSSKKEALTEIFKVSFANLDSELANFDHARSQIREQASKLWTSYLVGERKKALGGAKETPQQQKLMKRMSNVVLGGGRKTRKEFVSKLGKNLTIQDSHVWTLNHISVVQSLVRLQHNEHEQEENYLKRFTTKNWKRTTSELTRERGVWGPENEEVLNKWTLDSTEGPSRMRKRMMKDENFYKRYPHRSKCDNTTPKHKKPTSKDSFEYYQRVNCLSPYYNPENHNPLKSSESQDSEATPNADTKHELESSSDELENDDTVILNLCLKCQPDQLSADLKVNTLKGKEALSCDICGRSLDQFDANNIEPIKTEVGDAPSAKVGIIDTDQSCDETENTEDKPELTATKTGTNTMPVSDSVTLPNDETAEFDSPPEQGLAAQKQLNGLVPSDSVSSPNDPGSQERDKQDNQTILKLLEKGEKIKNMFRVARVQGLDVHEGLLLFGQDHYYIIDGFTMLKSKEIRDISSLPGEHEPIIPSSSRHSQDNLKSEAVFSDRMCSKFSYSDIREVHKRRYLLQNIALEVFNKDGRNCLLVFPQNTRTKVYSKFTSFAPTHSDRGKDSIAGQRSGLSVELVAPTWFGLIGEKTVTSRWERGEISNFQYLMYLNTLAGRSYNDLMQYPIFPWIIADYDSEVLDLTNPETFRDLSQPMGSQTPSRLEQYKKRYKDWEELGGIETPPYHYGTHYSSAMIVASYLVRMEPFTQHFLRLQGGHFDLADRMFHSIKDSWTSASQKNMADVKELIPEFFYLPEFLLNTNRFDLGQKQNGVHLDDVILPAWARGSTHEFIRAHREALECDYVSSHLHEWIDLIFGYKQKGEAALEANNVFHHLFYEGEVDIYSIKDPLKRNATIGFINNFGQIPKQLFKRPHPQKKTKADANSTPADSKVFYKHIESLSTPTLVKEIQDPVGHIAAHDRGVFVTEKGKLLIPPQNARYLAWGHKDLSVRVGNYESDRATQIFEDLGCDEITCAAMATESLLVTGSVTSVVHVWQLPTVKDKNKNMQLVKCLYGHTRAVSSVAVCASYGIIVSGSEDGSCILWDLNHLAFVRQLQHHHDAPISNICINEKTGIIVTSSGTNLYQWSINGQLITCASALSSNARSQHITALSMSKLNEWDPDAVIITGHSDGHLRFWRLEYVQVPESSNLLELQMLSDPVSKRNPAMQHLLTVSNSPDTLSLASVGEVAELPWNDVTKVELNNHEQARSKEATSQPKDAITLKWKEQLVLKGKVELPSFSNKVRGSYAPPVTSIAMSKNHESLYVGDEEGRVFLWTCS